MKKRKLKPEELVTEHIAVTEQVFSLLWKLKIATRARRLSDVILNLLTGKTRSPAEWEDMIE